MVTRGGKVAWLVVVVAVLAIGGPAAAGGGDASAGDASGIGGTNIGDLKDQVREERLGCRGASGGAPASLAGALALGWLSARRRRKGALTGP